MNRRVQGQVKQKRKRAEKRRQIHMGRQLSMQQYLHNTHHHAQEGYGADAEGNLLPRSAELVLVQNEVVDTTATHVLVRRTISLVDGKEVEAEIERGTEGKMRGMRANLMRNEHEESGTIYSVRKLKVVA